MQARTLLLFAIVGALCLTAAIAVVVLLSGQFDETSWRILGTTSSISSSDDHVGDLTAHRRIDAHRRCACEAPGRDFASAVAAAIRNAENEGKTVKRIERV